jgi:hypothetical protein
MDEVKAMAVAGERVGRAVGTGVHIARQVATHTGRAGASMSKQAAARAQQELVNRGVSTDEIREMLAQPTSSLSATNVARTSRRARRYLARNTRAARKELAARIDPSPRRSRRKWPWVLVALTALGVAVAIVLSRRPEEMPTAEADHDRSPEHDAKRLHHDQGSMPLDN